MVFLHFSISVKLPLVFGVSSLILSFFFFVLEEIAAYYVLSDLTGSIASK